MNTFLHMKNEILSSIQALFKLDQSVLGKIDILLNLDKDPSFGDLSCNAAMVLAKELKQNPRQIAQKIQEHFKNFQLQDVGNVFEKIELAGPGFLNFTFVQDIWRKLVLELYDEQEKFFTLNKQEKRLRYSLEFVSANPTGPLHLGAGRNGIIGDVLSRVLSFLGHEVYREYWVNDAGNQIKKLGTCFQIRCKQQLGQTIEMPEDGYVGDYLIELAKKCVSEFGDSLQNKDENFFIHYAKEHMLKEIKKDLQNYGISFDAWPSEKKFFETGKVQNALDELKEKKLAYEKEGALWFKATEFGDDKDRVIKKSSGEMTYIAGDIAYHKDKFERGFDKIIDIMGQDHHGYVARLKATMQALGFDAQKLDVILYQLVSIKEKGLPVKMSKRAGTFTTLRELVQTVGVDVARFFYLNRKAEAHLEFDLAVALKKTQENPVFYIQYAYVRGNSLLSKACEYEELKNYVEQLRAGESEHVKKIMDTVEHVDRELIKKIISLHDILRTIASSHQTHLLAYYSWELANKFHNFYTNNRIIDLNDLDTTKKRLFLVTVVHQTLQTCLKLLGISCPERM